MNAGKRARSLPVSVATPIHLALSGGLKLQ
jgi:hypothetical protein